MLLYICNEIKITVNNVTKSKGGLRIPKNTSTMNNKEMKNLEMVQAALEQAMKDELVFYEIEEVWFDYGAGVKHTTIIAYPHRSSSWQILTPKQLSKIKKGEFTINDINELAENNKRLLS